MSDGFQIHTCHRIAEKTKVDRNWLINLHNQQTKKVETEKETKTVKTPTNTKISKRKRYSESPSNNLTKYFKTINENLLSKN